MKKISDYNSFFQHIFSSSILAENKKCKSEVFRFWHVSEWKWVECYRGKEAVNLTYSADLSGHLVMSVRDRHPGQCGPWKSFNNKSVRSAWQLCYFQCWLLSLMYSCTSQIWSAHCCVAEMKNFRKRPFPYIPQTRVSSDIYIFSTSFTKMQLSQRIRYIFWSSIFFKQNVISVTIYLPSHISQSATLTKNKRNETGSIFSDNCQGNRFLAVKLEEINCKF